MTGQLSVLGTGTMGAGIAQVAATHGWRVVLADVRPEVAREAVARIAAQLDRLVAKGRLDAAARDAALASLAVAEQDADHADSDVVLEAVVEDLDAKAALLRRVLPALRPDAIVATNTSSLSVTDLGRAIDAGARTVGMHFFNPAPVLALVEIVAGADTEPAVARRAAAIATAWGKTVVHAADVPGFVVNQCARPYYLEAFRILEEGLADAPTIDAAMRDLGGFRMGPLELTDLIGQDVNTATTRSVWERLGRPALLAPSPLQESLVAAGHLGRKTGRGVYDHGTEPPRAALVVDAEPPPIDEAERAELDALARRAAVSSPAAEAATPTARLVFARILRALAQNAREAAARGTASPADIDLALRLGVNYPRGPLEWMAAAEGAKAAT